MEQPAKLPKDARGAAGDEIVDGHDLAIEAYGHEACNERNSGLLAFAYLWRRFGPPIYGSDPHKDLCTYILTTADPEVFLCLAPRGSKLKHGVAYMTTTAVQDEWRKPYVEWETAFKHWWWEQHLDEAAEQYWDARINPETCQQAEKIIGEFPRRLVKPWREDSGVKRRVNQALFDALRELLRPVYVRDVPINILGCCDDDTEAFPRAQRSEYAGYGVWS